MASVEQANLLLTPKKLYLFNDQCFMCGFSFREIFLTSTGRREEKKLFHLKLKLTKDRIVVINGVLRHEEMKTVRDIDEGDNSICVRCFNKFENHSKLAERMEKIRTEIRNNRLKVKQV